MLAGAIRAFALNGVPLKDQKILFFGAGSSGVGVAETIVKYFEHQGCTEQEAKDKFWLVDSKVRPFLLVFLSKARRRFAHTKAPSHLPQGLVAHNRGDKLPIHKQYLARAEPDAPKLRTLKEVVEHVKPTALLGLSTVGGTFTKEILQLMASYNKRPIVFALSNPVAQAECTFEEAVEGTDGRVLFAAGSPFDPVSYQGKRYEAGQGNNMVRRRGGRLGRRADVIEPKTDLLAFLSSPFPPLLSPSPSHESVLLPTAWPGCHSRPRQEHPGGPHSCVLARSRLVPQPRRARARLALSRHRAHSRGLGPGRYAGHS